MIDQVPGFRLLAGAARIKDWKRDDLALLVAARPAAAAGIFTRNNVQAAPVRLSRRNLRKSGGRARAVLLNAGCANACTGDEGTANTKRLAGVVAGAIGAKPEEILSGSTGVIGHQLPMDRMLPVVEKLARRPGDSDGLLSFAKAIMTTDTRPKTAGVAMPGLGGAVVAGAAKGCGMMAPNMATMLSVIATDAKVAPSVLDAALREAAALSFNAVTVDGDTSTNDTLLVLASGLAGPAITRAAGKNYGVFLDGLTAVCLSLAEQIARDGEGATKMVRVRVTGARTKADAARAARAVAQSPLVKTAMFGNDPNWGRVLCALGYSGAKLYEAKASLKLQGEWMFKDGTPLPFDAAALSKKMRGDTIELEASLGAGAGEATILTCDFSYDYVKINADYTT